MEDLLFVHCVNEPCSATSCYHCKTVLNDEVIDDDHEDFDAEEAEDALELHLSCVVWGMRKNEFESIIRRGMLAFCPKCGLEGQKDDAWYMITS